MDIQEVYDAVSNFAYDYQTVFSMIVGGTVMAVIAGLTRQQEQKKRNSILHVLRGKTMTRKQRLISNRSLQADAISDALFKLVDEGKQTIYDIQPTLRQLATFMFLTDLHVKKLMKVELTPEEAELLEGIMRSKEALLKLIQDKHKIKIPGGHPKDDVVVDVSYNSEDLNKAKDLAEQGLQRASALEELERQLYSSKKPFGGSLMKTTG